MNRQNDVLDIQLTMEQNVETESVTVHLHEVIDYAKL